MVHRSHVSEVDEEAILEGIYRNLDAVGFSSNLALEAACRQGPEGFLSPCEPMSPGNPEILIEKSPRHQV